MNVENSKKAIEAAANFYKSVMPIKIEDIRVEGIEMVDSNYKVTLSYVESVDYIFSEKKRHCNTFVIDDKFELVSMGVLNE